MNEITILLSIGVVLVLMIIVFLVMNKKQIENFDEKSLCKHDCKALLPVWDPKFNIKEIIKQMLLLEDHMFQKDKQCGECIRKHILTIEGFAEEGITLDKNNNFTKQFMSVLDLTRKLYDTFSQAKTHEEVSDLAKDVRTLRKELMTIV